MELFEFRDLMAKKPIILVLIYAIQGLNAGGSPLVINFNNNDEHPFPDNESRPGRSLEKTNQLSFRFKPGNKNKRVWAVPLICMENLAGGNSVFPVWDAFPSLAQGYSENFSPGYNVWQHFNRFFRSPKGFQIDFSGKPVLWQALFFRRPENPDNEGFH